MRPKQRFFELTRAAGDALERRSRRGRGAGGVSATTALNAILVRYDELMRYHDTRLSSKLRADELVVITRTISAVPDASYRLSRIERPSHSGMLADLVEEGAGLLDEPVLKPADMQKLNNILRRQLRPYELFAIVDRVAMVIAHEQGVAAHA